MPYQPNQPMVTVTRATASGSAGPARTYFTPDLHCDLSERVTFAHEGRDGSGLELFMADGSRVLIPWQRIWEVRLHNVPEVDE